MNRYYTCQKCKKELADYLGNCIDCGDYEDNLIKEIISDLESWSDTFHHEENEDEYNEEVEGTVKVMALVEKLKNKSYSNEDVENMMFHITNAIGQEGDPIEENRYNEKYDFLNNLLVGKKTKELFSGTKSFSKVAKKRGYLTWTIDNDESLNPDECIDIMEVPVKNMSQDDILWASPPCQSFSVASIWRNWDSETKEPKSDSAKKSIEILEQAIKAIAYSKPKVWFIENPRGMMRKVIDELFKKHNITHYKRETICYCRYGDSRMKPTDIWTNCFSWKPINKMCYNGCNDHESAPRGSKTGTQGLKDAKERGVIPSALFEEIFDSIEGEK